MKLYKLTQDINTEPNTYDSAIVCANSLREARLILPSPFYKYRDGKFYFQYQNKRAKAEKSDPTWTTPSNVQVQEIGFTDAYKAGDVVSASFNAGFDESRYLDLRRIKLKLQNPLMPKMGRMMAERTKREIERQLKDKKLSLLRCWLVEANRERNQKKIFEAEQKVKDYLKEELESYV